MAKSGYIVDISKYQDSYESDGQEWGWSESWNTNTFNGIKKVTDEKYPDVVSDHDIAVGERCYVVWFEYSTGCTFGQDHRGCTDTTGVFKDKAVAEELKRAIEKFTKNANVDKMDPYKFKYSTSDGQVFEYGFAPWIGYFETLEDVHVEETYMK